MKIFKTGCYCWWQIGLLKLALLFIGVVIGAYWPTVFLPYTVPLLLVAIILGIYLLIIWVRQ